MKKVISTTRCLRKQALVCSRFLLRHSTFEIRHSTSCRIPNSECRISNGLAFLKFDWSELLKFNRAAYCERWAEQVELNVIFGIQCQSFNFQLPVATGSDHLGTFGYSCWIFKKISNIQHPMMNFERRLATGSDHHSIFLVRYSNVACRTPNFERRSNVTSTHLG